MLIDIVFIVLMVIAIVKGYRKGAIIAVFSLIALMAGLAAAIKLSVVTAAWMKDSLHVGAKWLPVIAFAAVFIAVVLLVRLGAGLLEKTAELALLGWANKIAGMLLYIAVYTVMLSVLLFYAEKVSLVATGTIASSKVYSFIQPLGPRAMNAIGTMIPVFKDMFMQLEDFFAGISAEIHPA